MERDAALGACLGLRAARPFCARRHIAFAALGHSARDLPSRRSVRAVVAWWDWVWPPAALGVALAVNVAWIGLIGYGLVRLL